MKNGLITAIDIGTAMTRVVVAEQRADSPLPYIVAAASVPSAGVRRGSVVDAAPAAHALADALRVVEVQAGTEVRSALFSVGGTQMATRTSKGVVVVGRADGEIASDDVDRVLLAAQAVSIPANKEIVHVLPRRYRIDDQADVKDPIGMTGVRLEMEAFIVDAPVQHLRGIDGVAQAAAVDVEELVMGPLAAADAVLTRQQKELGVVLVVIGAATTAVVVYEEGDLIHASVLPVGAGHVTNDLAIGLRTAIDTAETVKLRYGVAIAAAVDRREECDLAAVDPHEEGTVSRFHIGEIIQARMEEIFGLVQDELVRIGKAELLPAGAVLVGGGAKLPYIVTLAKKILRLPVRIGEPVRLPGMFDRVDDPAFVTALGLVHWAVSHERLQQDHAAMLFAKKGGKMVAAPIKTVNKRIVELFERFFP